MLKYDEHDPRKFTAKVCDFGLARMCHGSVESVNIFGTISHMPPGAQTTAIVCVIVFTESLRCTRGAMRLTLSLTGL